MATPTSPTSTTTSPRSTLQSSESNLNSLSRTESSGKIFAQTSFFNTLLRTGYQLEILKNATEWKSFHYRFVAESCALESREDKDKPTSKLLSFISLRKFAISYSPTDPLRFAIKTPNKVFQIRTREQTVRTLWLDWLKSIEKDSSVMAEHALRLTGQHDKVLTTNDKTRPPYWVPKDEADFCACCHKEFKAFSGRHTCRDCGFIYCSEEACFTDGTVKRCNVCLTIHQTVNSDGIVKKNAAPTPLFNETSSSKAHTYFQDLNVDPLILKQQQLDEKRKELEEKQKHQLIIDGQAGLTTINNQTVYVGEDIVNNKTAISNLLSKTTDPKQRMAIQKNKLNQLYAQREVQRVDKMKKIHATNGFGDLLLILLVIGFILYFVFGQQVKSLFDILMKSL